MNSPTIFPALAVKRMALIVSISHANFSRTVFSVLGVLLLLTVWWLWQPGQPVQAYGRLTINAPVEEAFTLPEAKAGVEFEYQFQTEGGLAPLKWSVVAGVLPPGLRLEETGKLRGVPTQAKAEAYAFVVEVSDSAKTPQRFSLPCLLLVHAAPLRIVTGAPKLRIVTSEGHKNTPPAQEPQVGARQPQENDLLVNIAPGALITPISGPARTPNPATTATTEPGLASSAAPKTTVSAAAQTPTPTPSPAIVCGRLRPASLDHILAIIPTLPSVKAVLDKPNPNESESRIRALWQEIQLESRFRGNNCQENSHAAQRLAMIKFLEWLLAGIEEPSQTELKSAEIEKTQDATLQGKEIKTIARDNRKPIELRQLEWTDTDKKALEAKASRLSAATVRHQILFLSGQIGGITVMVTDKKGKALASGETDSDGNYRTEIRDFGEGGPYAVTTEADHRFSKKEFVINPGGEAKEDLQIEDRPVSLLARAVVGYQQAGAASTDFEQNYFFDLFVSQTLPFPQKIDPNFGEGWRTWGAIRAISVPQKGDETLADFLGTGANSFVTKFAGQKLNEAARVFDYLGGVEWRWFGNTALLPSFDRYTKQKFSLSFIAGGGFVTPTNPTADLPKVYLLTDQIKSQFNQTDSSGKLLTPQLAALIKDKQYLAFLSNDRDRFFRQFYAGFRMQTFYFNRHNIPLQRFPTQLDLTVGQNEYVTGGKLRGPVIRLDAYYPLPYDKFSYINLFGTAVFKWAKVKETMPLLLKEALDKDSKPLAAPTDPGVALIPLGQFNRDYYRVGIGIDLPVFFQKLFSKP